MKRHRHKLRDRDNFAADIVVLLDDEHVGDPSRLTATLDEIHANGFRSALVGLRTTQFEITDGKVLAAFRHAAESGAERGLAIWLQVDLRHAPREFLRRFPKCRQQQMLWATAPLGNGQVSLSVPTTQSEDAQALTAGAPRLLRAYAMSAEQVSNVTRQVELRPAEEGWVAGWDPRSVAGEEIAVFATIELDTFDYARLEAVRFAKELVATVHREVGSAAGLWTNEPGHLVPGGWKSLFVSEAFFHEFRERHRYDLRDRLGSLAWDLPTSGCTRQDAASTWADMVFRVHSMLRTQAAHHFGGDVNVGVCGSGRGIRVPEALRGNGDWFRFAVATQTGGFTSGALLDEERTHWGLALARSLGKYHPERLAHHATWGAELAGSRSRHLMNLLCVQSVRWIAAETGHLCAHDGGNSTPAQVWNFRVPRSDSGGAGASPHATVDATVRANERSQFHTFQCVELAADAARDWGKVSARFAWTGKRTGFEFPRANVAVLYNWRTAARLWGETADSYQRSLCRLAGTLTRRGIAFDILSPDHLTSADDMTESGGFTRAEETYDAIVYPWPVAHTSLDWEVLLAYLEEGGKAVLYGHPPELAGAEAIGEGFGELLGVSVPAAARFGPSRQPIEFRGQTVPVVDAGPLATMDAEGEPRVATTAGATLGVRSKGGNCWYLSYDAGLMTPTIIPQLLDDLGVPRLFRAPAGVIASRIGDLVVCADDWGRSLRGAEVRVEDRSFTIQEAADLAIINLNTGEVEAFTE
jgi:hypothetical protein